MQLDVLKKYRKQQKKLGPDGFNRASCYFGSEIAQQLAEYDSDETVLPPAYDSDATVLADDDDIPMPVVPAPVVPRRPRGLYYSYKDDAWFGMMRERVRVLETMMEQRKAAIFGLDDLPEEVVNIIFGYSSTAEEAHVNYDDKLGFTWRTVGKTSIRLFGEGAPAERNIRSRIDEPFADRLTGEVYYGTPMVPIKSNLLGDAPPRSIRRTYRQTDLLQYERNFNN